MVLLYIPGCGSKNSFIVFYWHIPLLNKQDSNRMDQSTSVDEFASPQPERYKSTFMLHLYLCLPDRCGQKIYKSKGDRQCKIGKIGQKDNVCLFCFYVFSVRTGQADRGINALLRACDT